MSNWLERRWYRPVPPPVLLQPLSRLFGRVAAARAQRLRARSHRDALPVPVIVVGNLTVGGAGKTPVTIWLVEQLRALGWTPGVISRGYGARAPRYPYAVQADSDPAHCGDEPLLIVRRTAAPLVVDPDRLRAARFLCEHAGIDVIVSDDGLQHYRLPRDAEICVVDGARGLGNGWLLPAGPLREPPSRLQAVDLVVVNGAGWTAPDAVRSVGMRLQLGDAWPLAGGVPMPLFRWRGKKVHAVAGIGNPQRFFDALAAEQIDVVPHAFADHHAFRASDLSFGDDLPVLMTEKDAMKCLAFAPATAWAVPATAQLTPDDAGRVQELLQSLKGRR
ncbi:MAG TPA: tetraacyldisaccharide 4'-kinase [Solimonas sp.]